MPPMLASVRGTHWDRNARGGALHGLGSQSLQACARLARCGARSVAWASPRRVQRQGLVCVTPSARSTLAGVRNGRLTQQSRVPACATPWARASLTFQVPALAILPHPALVLAGLLQAEPMRPWHMVASACLCPKVWSTMRVLQAGLAVGTWPTSVMTPRTRKSSCVGARRWTQSTPRARLRTRPSHSATRSSTRQSSHGRRGSGTLSSRRSVRRRARGRSWSGSSRRSEKRGRRWRCWGSC
mmetsp:Transcript_55292/g.161353  ORF Transcript_55292/g.161353 Transcript_55292/m.161353 type:complete len:242 (-) Transcript_55292:376-1101(-)